MVQKRNTTSSATASLGFTSLTYGRRLLLTACIFVVMMTLAGMGSQLAAHITTPGTRAHLLLTGALQNIIGFGGTALATAVFLSVKPMRMLGLRGGITWRALLGIILVFAVGLPLLNQIIYWNAQMHFPAAMHHFEDTLRGWEQTALSATNVMMKGTSWGTLIVNILLMGVLTGLCEELLFRGTFQRVIASGGVGAHLSIWITAIIFSILHFQFFGFIPRVLLGAFFGYIFYWTGSVWVSASAHAFNNSMVVLTSWLAARGSSSLNFENIGVTEHGFPVVACISLALTMAVLVGMRGYLFKTGKK